MRQELKYGLHTAQVIEYLSQKGFEFSKEDILSYIEQDILKTWKLSGSELGHWFFKQDILLFEQRLETERRQNHKKALQTLKHVGHFVYFKLDPHFGTETDFVLVRHWCCLKCDQKDIGDRRWCRFNDSRWEVFDGITRTWEPTEAIDDLFAVSYDLTLSKRRAKLIENLQIQTNRALWKRVHHPVSLALEEIFDFDQGGVWT